MLEDGRTAVFRISGVNATSGLISDHHIELRDDYIGMHQLSRC